MSATQCFLLLKRASPPRRARRPDRAVHAAAVADRLDLRAGVTRRDRRPRRPLSVRRAQAARAG